jgi:hypothetical protein
MFEGKEQIYIKKKTQERKRDGKGQKQKGKGKEEERKKKGRGGQKKKGRGQEEERKEKESRKGSIVVLGYFLNRWVSVRYRLVVSFILPLTCIAFGGIRCTSQTRENSPYE